MSNHTTKRSRRTREQWQVLIDNFNANPIDPQTYCKQIGVTMDRFKIWQRRFSRPGFVEVAPTLVAEVSTTSANNTSAASGHWDVELSLGADTILRLRTR